jgi:glycosyltransferase involved in cell wall biosynthesis
MHIAYISTLLTAPWGGSEELWYQSAMIALEKGHQVSVFIREWPLLPEKLRILQKSGGVIITRSKQSSLIIRTLKKSCVDSIYFNSFYALLRIKPDCVIVTDGSTYYTANNADLSEILINHFEKRYCIICQANAPHHLPIDRKHALNVFKKALKVVFVSNQNRDLCFHQLADVLPNTQVIQNPVLLNDYELSPFPELGEYIHCALIGRYSITEKGQDILISILSDPYWKREKIIFHLYGEGADEEYLRDLINYYQVGSSVKMEGYESNKDNIWSKCHCLLMCSHIEGIPLTLLEAMVKGRVCIVTQVGGNSEWITDSINGYLVDFPNKQSFSEKLKIAISNKAQWPSISRNAHRTAMERLDLTPGDTLLKQISTPLP